MAALRVNGGRESARSHPAGWMRAGAEALALVYIALIAEVAVATGAFYVMFPELGALSHDVFTRPRGTWANSPIMLAITPALTGAIGIAITRGLPYGYVSVLLNVAAAIVVIVAMGSPIAPAISAGLLPLVLGVTSWWYPPGILFGTIVLALLSTAWRKIAIPDAPAPPADEERVHEVAEQVPARWEKIAALLGFVAIAVMCVNLTGWRFILFPPLVVIGFEMFVHPHLCPWADRPLMLPLACFLTAAGGLAFWHLFGAGPLAAACAMGWGIGVLRLLDLHVPPALAVALLPLVMDHPRAIYPVSVGAGTLLLTLWFRLCERVLERVSGPP